MFRRILGRDSSRRPHPHSPSLTSKGMAMDLCVSAPQKELDERMDTFHLSASTFGGTAIEITDVNASTSVEELLDHVESGLSISHGCSTVVTATGELLSRGHACISLADAGIVSGSSLTVTIRGMSLYKSSMQAESLSPGFKDRIGYQQPFHLLLYGDGVCRLAFLRKQIVDHAGGPDHYTSTLQCQNILVGTHVLDGDVAVCTWTKHFEYIPPCLDTFCVRGPYLEAQLVGPKEAIASEKYQRIHLNECDMFDTIDPILSESDLPTSTLGLGLFETDQVDSLENRWRN